MDDNIHRLVCDQFHTVSKPSENYENYRTYFIWHKCSITSTIPWIDLIHERYSIHVNINVVWYFSHILRYAMKCFSFADIDVHKCHRSSIITNTKVPVYFGYSL